MKTFITLLFLTLLSCYADENGTCMRYTSQSSPMIHVMIGVHEYVMAVDTGATTTTIRPHVVEAEHLTVSESDIEVSTVRGSTKLKTLIIPTIVYDGFALKNVRANVSDFGDPNLPTLFAGFIGLQTLQQADFLINNDTVCMKKKGFTK